MLKGKILAAVTVLAALCFVGCKNETVQPEAAEPTELVGMTNVPSNSGDPHFVPAFEITDWTMEELADNISLCGEKITLPCKLSDVKEKFDVSETELPGGGHCLILSHKNKEAAVVSCDTYENDDAVITNISYGLNMKISGINIMGITEKSSAEDVKKILGEPNYTQDDGYGYRYIFEDNKQVMFHFDKEKGSVDFYYIINE